VCCLLLERLAPDLEGDEVFLLPFYVKFGVPNAAAAYLRLLGASDRSGATALSLDYQRGHLDIPTLRDVEQWLRSPDARAALRRAYGGEPYGLRILERELGLQEPPVLGTVEPVTVRLETNEAAEVGEFCQIRNEGRQRIATPVFSSARLDGADAFGVITSLTGEQGMAEVLMYSAPD